MIPIAPTMNIKVPVINPCDMIPCLLEPTFFSNQPPRLIYPLWQTTHPLPPQKQNLKSL